MCKTLIPMLETRKLFFSHKVAFYLHELVNKHDIRYWCETNPRVTIELVMKSTKLNICCAMSKNQLIRPFFFEDDMQLTEKIICQCFNNFSISEILK